MLNFASQEFSEWHESNNYFEFAQPAVIGKLNVKSDSVKLFAEKLRVPAIKSPVARPRLIKHLEKSLAQFSATLIAGRVATGKTWLAADFARLSNNKVSWYKAETADADWKVFSSYLAAAGKMQTETEWANKLENLNVSAASELLANGFNQSADEKPLLIVIDDLHSVFDAEWFSEFFQSFVPLLAPNVRLLLIARTLPPLQLWRLRSKQVLGLIDEKLLSFTEDETIELFKKHKLTSTAARSAHLYAFGKIGRLNKDIEKKTAKLGRSSV